MVVNISFTSPNYMFGENIHTIYPIKEHRFAILTFSLRFFSKVFC